MEKFQIRKAVRKKYADTVKRNTSCCGPEVSCCGGTITAGEISRSIGYAEDEIRSVPEGANLGLGCGNPTALASLKEGETVLDLGSGAGFDCFLAANKVGEEGKVIGVDMTPEMIDKARESARAGNYENVEFRLGEIENIPAADDSVDVVISNCVINLSIDKGRVFKEAFRILKPGGRMMVSDIVLLKDLPDSIKKSIDAYAGCVSGAMLKDEYIGLIKKAGFVDVRIIGEAPFPADLINTDPLVKAMAEDRDIQEGELRDAAESVISINIRAGKRDEKSNK